MAGDEPKTSLEDEAKTYGNCRKATKQGYCKKHAPKQPADHAPSPRPGPVIASSAVITVVPSPSKANKAAAVNKAPPAVADGADLLKNKPPPADEGHRLDKKGEAGSSSSSGAGKGLARGAPAAMPVISRNTSSGKEADKQVPKTDPEQQQQEAAQKKKEKQQKEEDADKESPRAVEEEDAEAAAAAAAAAAEGSGSDDEWDENAVRHMEHVTLVRGHGLPEMRFDAYGGSLKEAKVVIQHKTVRICNVVNSTGDKYSGGWLKFWRDRTGRNDARPGGQGCAALIQTQKGRGRPRKQRCKNVDLRGGHVWLEGQQGVQHCYIVPLCAHHNNSHSLYDYPNWFTTNEDIAMVRIPARMAFVTGRCEPDSTDPSACIHRWVPRQERPSRRATTEE